MVTISASSAITTYGGSGNGKTIPLRLAATGYTVLANELADHRAEAVTVVISRSSIRMRHPANIVAYSSVRGIARGFYAHVHHSAAKAGVIGLLRARRDPRHRRGDRYVRMAQSLSQEHSLGPPGAENTTRFIPSRVGQSGRHRPT